MKPRYLAGLFILCVSACMLPEFEPIICAQAVNADKDKAAENAVRPASSTAGSPENIQVALQPAGDDEVVEMSPFVVQAERDAGYIANDSLAGTRLRTPLKDIGASISVVTKDLLDDLAATNAEELLIYTAGTEVTGIGGNFSDSTISSGAQTFEAARDSANPATRVRGLAAADQTRNYFLNKAIPMDSYNTASVTLNRGANSILFGFGSPAGIIENSLLAPRFSNSGEVRFMFGSYDSHRTSVDIERVIIPRKLSIRVAVLDDNRRYEQRSTFRDQERYYGAVTFKPFRNTTLRVNAEKGNIDQRTPRVDPPLDALSSWWDYGKQTRANNFTPKTVIDPERGVETTYQRQNNLDGMFGYWSQNVGLLYDDVLNPMPAEATIPYARIQGTDPIVTYRYLAPRNSYEVQADIVGSPISGFLIAKQLIDRSIFDYRKELLEGPNGGTSLDFNTQNIALEQLFFNGNAGIELSYDRQSSLDSIVRPFTGRRSNAIYIDVNTVTIDGRPNPNFGRPFTGGWGFFKKTKELLETYRATAYANVDFSKKRWGFLSRLLGRHTLTGLYSIYERKQDYHGGFSAAVDPDWRDGLNGNTLGTSRKISTLIYLGPSLADADSPSGANLMGVRVPLTIPKSVDIMTFNQSTNYQWERQTVPTYTALENEDYLANNVQYNKNKVTSYAGVWQGYWMDSALVSTLGWRHDTDETASGSAATNTDKGSRPLDRPELTRSNETSLSTVSYGFALHVPDRWLRRIPGRPSLSFYYNSSENFDVSAGVRRDLLGNFIGPQNGESKEYGFRIGALKERASVRMTWYKTTQANMTDPRISTPLSYIASLEAQIARAFTRSQLESAGYLDFEDPGISDIFRQYLDFFNFTSVEDLPDGRRSITYTTPANLADVTRSVSEGCEIEGVFNATKNWRIAFNVVRQKATRGETSPNLIALMDDRLSEWQKIWDWQLETVNTVAQNAMRNVVSPVSLARLSNGERAPELREWRVNVITNYNFSSRSFLKGWGVGGAFRWEDSQVIGYPIIEDPDIGLVSDVRHPFMGPTQKNFDGWISFSKKLKYFGLKIQLNIRNLLNENKLVAVRANPIEVGNVSDFDVAAYRIGAERRYEITTTFSF